MFFIGVLYLEKGIASKDLLGEYLKMSWLISMVLAGMAFAAESALPVYLNGSHIETNKTQIVRLDETERFEQTYPLNPNGRVSVSNINGSITVEAWDRNEVKLVAVKTADTRARLAEVQIKIDARPDYLRVETDYEIARRPNTQKQNHGKLEVQYHLTVPRGAVLNQIETINGSVTVSNMTNTTKVSAVNGQVKATNLRGTASLVTVNGNVDADFAVLQAGSQITVNTVAGRANLVIPSDANVTIQAGSLNGNIVNDFGLPVRKGQFVGRDLYGKVGNGDVKIKLNSVNGDLTVRRKQDGKTILPATNLLQSGNTTIYGVNNQVLARTKAASKAVPSAKVEIPSINAEVQKAMIESQKEMAKAKVYVNTEEFNKKWQEGMKLKQLELARMGDVYWIAGTPAIEKKSEAFPVKGVPRVSIEAKNCSVTVRGWDKQEVSYAITKFSRAAGNTLDTRVTHSDTSVNINVTENGKLPVNVRGISSLQRVRIEVFVPKKSNLRIRTDGEIRLENVSGEIDLQGAAEAINVRDADGKLTVGTTDGRIRVIGFRGVLTAKSTEGMMNLEGDFENLSAQTVEGTIVLTLPENANADIESNSKTVIAEGFALNRVSEGKISSKWKIGSGGNNHRLNSTADGQVIIRSAGNLRAN
jgi:DUF4097 and DUF4098 domain-containing protein YvlB